MSDSVFPQKNIYYECVMAASCAEQTDQSAKAKFNSTSLHNAAWWGEADRVEKVLVIENLNSVNKVKRTPLDDALIRRREAKGNQIQQYEKIIDFLKSKGGLTFEQLKNREQERAAQNFSECYDISVFSSKISVKTDVLHGVNWGQEIDGFGATLTHSSAYLLHSLCQEIRTKILSDLFHTVNGIGLSYLRIPMGTSDFRPIEDYTYADLTPEETHAEQVSAIKNPNLNQINFFSIKKDQEYLIPILQEIRKINPTIKIMGSPWSPPEWMKIPDNGYLRPEMYAVYALYFVKFIQAYAEEKIQIHAITLQNEPRFQPAGYKGMQMEAEDQIRFSIILGRAFAKEKITTKIAILDHNWEYIDYVRQVLDHPDASYYIDGVAFHGYGGQVETQSKLHEEYPQKAIYFTECGGTLGSKFEGDLEWDMTNLVIGATKNWAKCVLKWNLVLDPAGGPKIPGGHEKGRGVITVDPEDPARYIKNVEYYALGHASKFVRPGARRIIPTDQDHMKNLDYVIFANPADFHQPESLIFILFNKSDHETKLAIELSIWKGGPKEYLFNIEGKSACTLVFEPNKDPKQITTNKNKFFS